MRYLVYKRNADWQLRLSYLFCSACFSWCWGPGLAFGQADKPQQTQQSSKQGEEAGLTEGLLDLLKEPASEKPAAPKGSRSDFKPSDVGLEGEDLGEDAAHPLNSVRQSMFIAAGMLGRGTTGSETQRLQSDIVQRLDELIEQLEQSPNNQNQRSNPQNEPQQNQASQPASQDQQNSGNQNPDQESQERRTGRRTVREGAGSTEVSETDGQPQQPGQAGRQASGQVRLADPKALQQDVWGHLPERMRAQLQSRMVEQFLPSHREQIEAYFRALLDEQ